MLFRSMLDAIDAWATNGILPPESRIPKKIYGTLVDLKRWKSSFPNIQGASLPDVLNELSHYNFGADIETGNLPKLITLNAYTVLVPIVDADGNDLAGARAPMVSQPLNNIHRMEYAQHRLW